MRHQAGTLVRAFCQGTPGLSARAPPRGDDLLALAGGDAGLARRALTGPQRTNQISRWRPSIQRTRDPSNHASSSSMNRTSCPSHSGTGTVTASSIA